MPNLLIVRGLPGSGKSTYVMNNYKGIFLMETDMFVVSDGKYTWNKKRHCESISYINEIVDRLVTSNNKPDFALCGVFCKTSSFFSHVEKAIRNGYKVYIKTLTSQYRNIHNVPIESINYFKQNFESDLDVDKLFKEHKLNVCFDEMPQIKWS